jgi:translation initiation factor 5A
MDLDSFEVFETSAVEDEIRDKISQGSEVEYWSVLDKIKIVRVKGGR